MMKSLNWFYRSDCWFVISHNCITVLRHHNHTNKLILHIGKLRGNISSKFQPTLFLMFGSNVFVCTLSNMKKYKRRLVVATIFKNKNSRKSITIDNRTFIMSRHQHTFLSTKSTNTNRRLTMT